jgi:Terminase RNaseH-like domain
VHEREARVNGTPMLGSGRVFPIAEESIRVTPFAIPKHWPRIAAVDFGWDHPTAGAWLAWDRDTDVAYLYDCYKVREATPVVHAAVFKAKGEWIPVAWPHDGEQTEKGSGESLAAQYKRLGLRMLPEHATFVDGGNSVEAGVLDMLTRMQTARLKVFEHLGDFFDEFRLYHSENGKIVKEYDDVLSAVRYGIMMLRAARVQPDFSQGRSRMADGLDWNPLDPHGTNSDSRRSTPGVVWGNGRPANLEHRSRSDSELAVLRRSRQ